MKKDTNNSPEFSLIQGKAEELERDKQTIKSTSVTDSSLFSQSEADILKSNYELKVRQIELEMQIEELRLREVRHNALFANSGEIIGITGSDGTVEYLSPNFEKYFGWKAAEIVGTKKAWSLVHPEDRDQLWQEFSTLIKNDNKTITPEFRIRCKDGNWRWVGTNAINKINDPDIHGVLVNYRDISDRKLAEEKVLKQNWFFEQIFSQSSVSTQILDKDGWCEKINTKLTELFGVNPEDIEGKQYNIFKDESLRREGILPILEKVFKEGKTAKWDIFFDIGLAAESQHITVADKNKKQWFHNLAYPIFDEENQLAHVIIQHSDISRYKRDQQMLSDSEARYRRLFESSTDGILILDAESGQIVDVNPYLIEMLGYSYLELLGKELWEIGVFKNIADSKEAFVELQDKGYIRFEDLSLKTKNGKPVSVEFVSNLYLVDQKKVIQCNVRNITARLH
ncbi:MAG TPA: hypothetical protein DCL77_21360, partial [Prolixibacteraceae bacterium]|nr:hypothetical protein [Prolixibacteraceae bacterium]